MPFSRFLDSSGVDVPFIGATSGFGFVAQFPF